MTDMLSENMEEKQGFAREQYEFLKEKGVDDRLVRSRIFKASGPGQVKEAWKLAHCEDFTTNEKRKNLLLCILGGSRKLDLWYREDFEAILEASNFENFSSKSVQNSLVLCIIGGSKKMQITREEMENILREEDFYVPEAHNNRCFFRILNGAGEILMPGFFRFSQRDIEIIQDGLKKRIYED